MLSAAVVQSLLDGDETQALENALILPYLSSTVYFLLSREKNLLYIIRLTQEAIKTTLEGVRHFVIKDQLAADFRRWLEPIEKCILIGNLYAENSVKIHFYVQTTVFVLFHLSHLILIAPRTPSMGFRIITKEPASSNTHRTAKKVENVVAELIIQKVILT